MLSITDFTAHAIRSDAARRCGADPHAFAFGEGLDRLVTALATEARLTPAGRAAVRASLVGALETQARLRRLSSEHPEIAHTPVPRPVFVTGLLRTGTTLVHNLLAQHPGLRVPALWELMHPAAGRTGTAETDRLVTTTQSYVDEYNAVAPGLKAIHFLDARRPDECHRLTANAMQSMVFEMRYRVPGYGAWLAGTDDTPAYAYHRRQLQAILWARPGGPVVLKCPFHLWSLESLMRVYPDARVVHLHRDPAETVPSTCSLCLAIRAARSDRVDPHEIGRQWLARIEAAVDDLDRARKAIPAGQLLDVRYRDLMADPIGTMRRVGEFIGVPLPERGAAAMRTYLSHNTPTTRGVHRYRAEDFGLDPADLRARFADYRATYDC